MSEQIATRAFRADDYDSAVQLWRQSEGVEVAEGDDRGTIVRYLERNPNLSRVALRGDRVVGAVLCGHDGRRGLVYHLAVADDERSQGIGRLLVDECLDGLRSSGIKRALILVADDNDRGHVFWEGRGFVEICGATPYGIDLDSGGKSMPR